MACFYICFALDISLLFSGMSHVCASLMRVYMLRSVTFSLFVDGGEQEDTLHSTGCIGKVDEHMIRVRTFKQHTVKKFDSSANEALKDWSVLNSNRWRDGHIFYQSCFSLSRHKDMCQDMKTFGISSNSVECVGERGRVRER
jgi:hypothetical protein